jgi:chromosome segregation ATPase
MDLGGATENLAFLGGGGLSIAAFARWFWARALAEMQARQEASDRKIEQQSRDLAELRDERLAGIEQRLRTFEAGCAMKHDRLQETLTRVEHTAADVTNILGWTKKLDGKLDRIAEDAAASRSRVDGQDRWLQNLDNAHQAHVGDRELHNGR